eukprot:Skav214443  [mRNA]  locus=scaffold586:649253:653478:- [translate_table: standard]
MAEEKDLWRSTGRGSLHPVYEHVAQAANGHRRVSQHANRFYQACGRVFAMAILHGCKLGRPLSRPFVRLLLHLKPKNLQELQAGPIACPLREIQQTLVVDH